MEYKLKLPICHSILRRSIDYWLMDNDTINAVDLSLLHPEYKMSTIKKVLSVYNKIIKGTGYVDQNGLPIKTYNKFEHGCRLAVYKKGEAKKIVKNKSEFYTYIWDDMPFNLLPIKKTT